jgi:hypothetical protein
MAKSAPMRPSWCENIGVWHDSGQSCRVVCGTCKQMQDVDLEALIGKKGRSYSLWNRQPRCSLTAGCRGQMLFMYGGRGPMQNARDGYG